jgi:hypothetical protein
MESDQNSGAALVTSRREMTAFLPGTSKKPPHVGDFGGQCIDQSAEFS